MILEQLGLRDFCLFRGTQVFDLTPVRQGGRTRPIVLFGGINGGGKTTLFDAIQLALYGIRARCSKRAHLTYEEFLLQAIHLGASPESGAGVRLSFRYAADGQERLSEVRRDWKLEGDKVRESLLVLEDGLSNYVLTRSWPQLVEELIPLEIAQLFFFDGEKIRTLAEDASSSAALGAAIKALLGLDLVERLIADAGVLQVRLGRQTGSAEEQAEVEVLEQELGRVRGRIEAVSAELAGLENRRQRARNEVGRAEGAFAAAGGKHWEVRQDRERRLGALAGLIRETEARLVTLAAGELPLALVHDLLARVEEQHRQEQLALESEIVLHLLAERDRRLAAFLAGNEAPAELRRQVEQYLQADREARRSPAGTHRRLGLSERSQALVRHLRQQRLRELAGDSPLLGRLSRLVQEREDLDRLLATTPEDGEMARVVEQLKSATEASTLLEEEARQLEAARESLRAEAEQLAKRFEQKLRGQVAREVERKNARRMVELAGRTRATMQEFLRRATAQKIDRLSALITESFRYLLHKQTLVRRILIDPESFAIALFDAAGQPLPRHRLSEGEKQIFAVSVLWGLARAAARPLPAVIDTPMSRLDAAHRRHLVERYFPHASHQVLLFSTDTEVDRHYYQALRPVRARAYHLDYDEGERVTVGVEGYFWKEAG